MKTFYGVYLESSKLSNALALIRYFGQPDNLRFSHITLRGPYLNPVPKYIIDQWNADEARVWSVRLSGPGGFFNSNQNTVIIKVDLLGLNDLVHKPDFVDSTPHLTLYDGGDPVFARNLLQILQKYDFHHEIAVSKIRMLDSKAPVGGDFMLLYKEFYENFSEIVGTEPSTAFARALRTYERLEYIERVLSANFPQHFSKLNPRETKSANTNLSLQFDFEKFNKY